MDQAWKGAALHTTDLSELLSQVSAELYPLESRHISKLTHRTCMGLHHGGFPKPKLPQFSVQPTGASTCP